MTDDYCELMDMPASMCAHCRGHRTLEEQAAKETRELRARLSGDPRWFAAEYPGVCGRCSTRFSPGTLIRQPSAATDFTWVAECCADPHPTGG